MKGVSKKKKKVIGIVRKIIACHAEMHYTDCMLNPLFFISKNYCIDRKFCMDMVIEKSMLISKFCLFRKLTKQKFKFLILSMYNLFFFNE